VAGLYVGFINTCWQQQKFQQQQQGVATATTTSKRRAMLSTSNSSAVTICFKITKLPNNASTEKNGGGTGEMAREVCTREKVSAQHCLTACMLHGRAPLA
jgi:hypothetical protein